MEKNAEEMGGYEPFFKNDNPFFERSEFPHLSDRQFNAYKKSFESDFTLDRDRVYKILREHDDDEKTYLKKGNTMGDAPPGIDIPTPGFINMAGDLIGTTAKAAYNAYNYFSGTPTENNREIVPLPMRLPSKGVVFGQKSKKKATYDNFIKDAKRLKIGINSANPSPYGPTGYTSSFTPSQPPASKTPSSKTPSSKISSSKTPSSKTPSSAPTRVPTGGPTTNVPTMNPTTNFDLGDIKGQAMPRFTKRDEPVIADTSYLPVGDSQAITASTTSDPTTPVSDLPTEHVIPTPAAVPPSGESNNFIPGGEVPKTPVTPLVIPPPLNDETLKNDAPGVVNPGLAVGGFIKALLGGAVGTAAATMSGPMLGGLAAVLVNEGLKYTLPNSYSEDYGARYARYIRFRSQARGLLNSEQYRSQNFGPRYGDGGDGFDGFDDDDKGPKGPKDGKDQVGLIMKDVSSFIKYASIPV